MTIRSSKTAAVRGVLVLLVATGLAGVAPDASATPPLANHPANRPGLCAPSAAAAVSFSDALDKVAVGGATVGGLSDIAYDRRSGSFVSTVDNHGADPARLWFYRNLLSPHISRPPLVLTTADGTPYTGLTADNEGLAVLPDGDYLVSSETEPSIRIFGRNGVQKSSLAVPPRFAVAPAGQATANATLEGLTVSPDGTQIVAAMEGPLSGDLLSAGAPATDRRFLIYRRDRAGSYRLAKQIDYQVDPGNRISEVQLYATGRLLVMEAAFSAAVGNSVELYSVSGIDTAPDVSGTGDLSAAPGKAVAKTLAVDVTTCPTLGATAKQPQANPLMDNYEGMTTRQLIGHVYSVTLISDDNFGATQTTRVLNLIMELP